MFVKRIISFLCACALFLGAWSIAMAHGGGTDGKGGHTDHSTGEYHYHHGKPAHQHPNGVCPYATPKPTVKPTPRPAERPTARITPKPTAKPQPTTRYAVSITQPSPVPIDPVDIRIAGFFFIALFVFALTAFVFNAVRASIARSEMKQAAKEMKEENSKPFKLVSDEEFQRELGKIQHTPPGKNPMLWDGYPIRDSVMICFAIVLLFFVFIAALILS